MKISVKVVVVVLAMVLAMPAVSMAAKPKKYQVTGIVLALTADVITVQKGTGDSAEKWEIARGEGKVTGDLQVGAKVTIEYTMTAETVDVKEAPATKPK